MKHNLIATANATSITIGILFLACRVLVGAFPSMMFNVGQSLMHGIALTRAGAWNLTANNFVLGLISAMVIGWFVGYVFAVSYNLFVKK